MAEAVQSLFPEVKFGIGPATDEGFYYDFDLPQSLSQDDIPAIEAKMREVIAADLPFIREEADKETVRRLFSSQPYKLELIDELPDEEVTIYRQGAFTDLCRGPHVASTGEIKAFKLLSIAGAYWRGDEHRPMLQRIYGTAFETEDDLARYLARLEEAARRDHRKLGKELELFSIHEEAGSGLIFWHPKGALIRDIIEDFWKKQHIKRGYELVYTPHIAKSELWERSGHREFYEESMYPVMDIEGQGYLLKPMNCPGHILMYKSRLRSYRELPLRWAELGTVYRWERSGVLHGLTRVRGFTQDDAHIFCRPEQLEDEVGAVLEFADFMLKTFGFAEYEVFLSTRPEKYAGTIEVWEQATETLRRALIHLEMPYAINPGEGVFYGPKIDIVLKDALGRSWQGPTIQVDFNLPERFDITYIGSDGQGHRVAMIHRTLLGSMERFLGCLIEHYGGAFPVWLAPIQVMIIPITDRHLQYAMEVEAELKSEGLRVRLDSRNERMNLKIREAQLEKIPYMLMVGDKEVSRYTETFRLPSGEEITTQSFIARASVTVRLRSGEDIGAQFLDSFIARAKAVIEAKRCFDL